MKNLIKAIQNEHNGLTLAQATLVAEAQVAMQKGNVKLTFRKRNGDLREAIATTRKEITEGTVKGTGSRHLAVTPFFDVELGEWRSFAWENLVSVEKVND